MIAVCAGVFIVWLLIKLTVCYFMYKPAQSLPVAYQQNYSPGQAFLLMIPLFNLAWAFIFPKNLSQAFQAYFRAHNCQRDDCGEQLALIWAICNLASLAPYVGALAGIGGLVVGIMYLVKLSECKNLALQIQAGGHTPQTHDSFGDTGMQNQGWSTGGPSNDDPFRT